MHEFGILRDLVVILAAALAVVLVLSRLRLPTIAGFIVAGMLLGPGGLGAVRDAREVQNLAEIGVALLLFTIGLEFSLDELRRLGRLLYLGGGLQVGLTTVVVAGSAVLAGTSGPKGVFLGFLIALSSTAIVLKGLAERGEIDAPHGKLIVGILLFQDLAVVPMMLLTPALAGQGGGLAAMVRPLLTATAVVVGALALARLAVPGTSPRWPPRGSGPVRAGRGTGGSEHRLAHYPRRTLARPGRVPGRRRPGRLGVRPSGPGGFPGAAGYLHQPVLRVGRNAARPRRARGRSGTGAGPGGGAVLLGKALVTALAGLAMRFPLRVALLAGLGLAQVGESPSCPAGMGGELELEWNCACSTPRRS